MGSPVGMSYWLPQQVPIIFGHLFGQLYLFLIFSQFMNIPPDGLTMSLSC